VLGPLPIDCQCTDRIAYGVSTAEYGMLTCRQVDEST
jgi:hypothetical protein